MLRASNTVFKLQVCKSDRSAKARRHTDIGRYGLKCRTVHLRTCGVTLATLSPCTRGYSCQGPTARSDCTVRFWFNFIHHFYKQQRSRPSRTRRFSPGICYNLPIDGYRASVIVGPPFPLQYFSVSWDEPELDHRTATWLDIANATLGRLRNIKAD